MVNDAATYVQLHEDFESIKGDTASLRLLADTRSQDTSRTGRSYVDDQQNFHEACIYHPPSKSVFVTSNQLPNSILPQYQAQASQATGVDKHVKLWRIYDYTHPDTPTELKETRGLAHVHLQTFPGWEGALLNGGVNLSKDEVLLCAQGSKNPRDLQGLIAVSITDSDDKPAEVRTIVDSFNGIPFNSVNDVIVHPIDGSIWWTDPIYGFAQNIRPEPQLPCQVYRYEPKTESTRAIADGFTRPNGLCFSPDLKTLYVTDTGAISGYPDVPINLSGPSHIYAFDIVEHNGEDTPRSTFAPFLVNRRLFAYAPGRFPDGIKCDLKGNVYAGCGDGIEVWNPRGILIGIIKIDGGVANFCFGEKGAIYACNETKFWKIQLNPEVKGHLLGL